MGSCVGEKGGSRGKKVFLGLFHVCLFLKDEKRADKMTGLAIIDSFVFNI